MSGANGASVKHDLGVRVAEDEGELLGGEPKVERVDHPGAEERGVVQLQELVAVEGHDREAVVAADAELAAQPVREPQHPIDVLAVGRLVRPVEERQLVGQTVGGRQQLPVVDELLHAVPLVATSDPRTQVVRTTSRPAPRGGIPHARARVTIRMVARGVSRSLSLARSIVAVEKAKKARGMAGGGGWAPGSRSRSSEAGCR